MYRKIQFMKNNVSELYTIVFLNLKFLFSYYEPNSLNNYGDQKSKIV